MCGAKTYALVNMFTKTEWVCSKCSIGDENDFETRHLRVALKEILTEYLCRGPVLIPQGKIALSTNQIEIIKRSIIDISSGHLKTLALKRQRSVKIDDYGGNDFDENSWNEELYYYIEKYLYKDHYGFRNEFFALCSEILDKYVALFPKGDFNEDIPDDPLLYEKHCADILASLGWIVSTTKPSGDFGADIKAAKDGRIMVVQCKLYSSPVGIKAVQEIVAAVKYYNAQQAAVVSNNNFTTAAKELAAVHKVILCNHSQLVDVFKS
jgi:restriction system protein